MIPSKTNVFEISRISHDTANYLTFLLDDGAQRYFCTFEFLILKLHFSYSY